MVTIKEFCAFDLFKFNKVNFDHLTETYGNNFYMSYLARWPEACKKAVNINGDTVAYGCNSSLPGLIGTKGVLSSDCGGIVFLAVLGKWEGTADNWHGHVSALTVMTEYRKQGIAGKLMRDLEATFERKGCFFVDLFVRKSNTGAIKLYEHLGYTIYRTVTDYYGGDPSEDALDMRKALSRDRERKSVIPIKRAVGVSDIIEYY